MVIPRNVKKQIAAHGIVNVPTTNIVKLITLVRLKKTIQLHAQKINSVLVVSAIPASVKLMRVKMRLMITATILQIANLIYFVLNKENVNLYCNRIKFA